MLSVVLAAVFAFLWLRERAHGPGTAIREVERIKEVPVEKVREVQVPRKLTEQEKSDTLFARQFEFARLVSRRAGGTLYKIDGVDVAVSVTQAAKKVVSEERIRNELEFALGKANIRIDPKSPVRLEATVDGAWNDAETVLSFNYTLAVVDFARLVRGGDIRKALLPVWDTHSCGFVTKSKAEAGFMSMTEELAQHFANDFLAEREKEAAEARLQRELSDWESAFRTNSSDKEAAELTLEEFARRELRPRDMAEAANSLHGQHPRWSRERIVHAVNAAVEKLEREGALGGKKAFPSSQEIIEAVNAGQ